MGLGLEATIGFVVEIIMDTLLKSVLECDLEAEEYKLAESFAYVVKRILSVSRETKDGEMIHNLIIVLLVLSSCLNEKEAGYLATTVFTSWSVKKGDCEAFFVLFEPTLDQVYHNELGLAYQLSHWKIAKIFRAMFRWLTNKLDTFLVAGVKFETLESLYINTKVR